MTTAENPNQPAGLGPQLTPWAIMGTLVVAAGAARLATNVTDADAEIASGVAVTAFIIAVVAATTTKHRITSRKMRHRLTAASYLGAAWVSTVAYQGMSWGAIAALTILGTGLSLLWWREHRIGPTPPQPLGLDEDPTSDDLYTGRWARHVGAEGKQLAGSKLTDQQIIKSGYRYVLHLVPGTQTIGQVRCMMPILRGGLRLLPGHDLIVEEHPELPAPTGVLTVVTQSPVSGKNQWPGPLEAFDSRSGSVNLGPFADGEGVARFGVYRQDSMFGGYMQGGQGSGKSRMIDSICMALAASQTHPTIIWYIDGQNGSSSPLLSEHADWAALTPDAAHEMLCAAIRVMRINQVENRLDKRVGFTPTTARPGLLIVIDEQHVIFDQARNPNAVADRDMAAAIAREGRKVGVALLGASQSPLLDAFGGSGNNADTLRGCMLMGNGIVLRSKSSNAKNVFNVDVNPRAFPKLPGYAFLSDPDEGARSAPFRGYWVTDELAETVPHQITWRSLPVRQTNVAGEAYARRHEAEAEQIEKDELMLMLADAGMLNLDVEGIGGVSVQKPGGKPATPPRMEFGDLHPPVRAVDRFWVPEPRESSGLLPGQRKALDAISSGCTRPIQIMRATGYSESQVHNLIGDLQRLGLIHRAGHGQYQITQAA